MAEILRFPAQLRPAPRPAPAADPIPGPRFELRPFGAGTDADARAGELRLDLEELTAEQCLRVFAAGVARCAAELAHDQRRPAGDAQAWVLRAMLPAAERAATLAADWQDPARPRWPAPDGAA